MPPKSKKNEPSKKTVDKKKDKVIEDKTFGLKNKKGAKQQKYIQDVTRQVKHGNISARKQSELESSKTKKKDEISKQLDELNSLFKPVDQKVAKGVDPKSVVCAFFKQGQCGKGAKCKFSHDLNVGRKGEKRSAYDTEAQEDDMNDWDEEKLEEVVNKKHGASNKTKPQTAIICKYFLEAVENSKYGWFWNCPSGESCHYKHALPPGFVLKKDLVKAEKVEEISMEELIEKERAALNSNNLTKVTLNSFLEWKQRKRKEKVALLNKETDKKKADYKAGKTTGISGREMFEFNPDLVQDDDMDAEILIKSSAKVDSENAEEVVYDGPIKELNLEALAAEAKEADESGTVAKDRKNFFQNGVRENEKMDVAGAPLPNGYGKDATDQDLMMAASTDDIDENLFDGDDIDLIDDELETLNLES